MTKHTLLRMTALVLSALLLMAAFAGCKPKDETLPDVQVIDVDESPAPEETPIVEATPTPANSTDLPPDVAAALPDNLATPRPPAPDGIPDPNETPMPTGISYEKNYEKYKALNPEVIGWLKVPNTRINYPVTQAKDNEYYLHNNVEKKASKSGAVFMDYRNAKKDLQRHIIIYGHNMRNGTMFHDLNSYKLKEFFDQNRTITFWWNGKETKWEVYAAFIVTTDVNFIRTDFSSLDFLDYVTALQKRSKFSTDVKLKDTDQVMTLSTCTYEYDNARFVVQARRVT